MDNLKLYKDLIKYAKTKEELEEISYRCFLHEDLKVYNKVLDLCIKKEIELGIF